MANRTVYEQATTGFTGANLPITLPHIANDRSWQIPSYIMTAITNSCQFHNRDDEDTPAYINQITRLCSTFSIEGVNLDARYLQALVEKFYNGLTPEIKARFDTSAGGQLMGKKTVNECNDLFKSFAHSDMDYSTTSRTSTPVTTSSAAQGVNQVGLDSSVAAALEKMEKYFKQELNEIKKKVDRCEVEFIASQSRGPFNNNNSNYNSNWRGSGNNSGFRSSGNLSGFPSGQYQNRGPGLYTSGGSGQGGQFSGSGSRGQFASGGSNQVGQGSGKGSEGSLSRIEEMFAQLMRQVGGLANQLQENSPGQFSGNTYPNPINHSAKAITTRSGKSLGEVVRESVEIEDEEEVDEEIEMEAPGKMQHRLDPASTAHTQEPQVEKSVEKRPIGVRPSPLVNHSRVPYPACLKHQKYAKEYEQFLEMFKQLKINLPFIEALQSIPKYAKFLKDLLKRKDRKGELSNIPLTRGCSAVVLNKLPEKLTNPGTFTIPCFFGDGVTPAHSLADLGASINLMPFSLYEKLGLGELTPTRMS
ncbi:uncharacterized protein LOC110943543 [Helianthus annuus]|uniref:uncharacterized protein LOC110943543 n=1 Tax=Helianthus annuus TaxID=4232 RepID=UPI000B8FF17A|nr:uncharacterized protein LOC110943543 [Helianthus annuus]